MKPRASGHRLIREITKVPRSLFNVRTIRGLVSRTGLQTCSTGIVQTEKGPGRFAPEPILVRLSCGLEPESRDQLQEARATRSSRRAGSVYSPESIDVGRAVGV